MHKNKYANLTIFDKLTKQCEKVLALICGQCYYEYTVGNVTENDAENGAGNRVYDFPLGNYGHCGGAGT